MRTSIIFYLMIFIFSSCVTENEFNTEYLYTIRNDSDYDLSIIGFSNNIETKRISIPSNELYQESIYGNGTDNTSIAIRILESDSVKIIYDNIKFDVFKCSFENNTECFSSGSPFNSTNLGNSYTVTIDNEDYENAKDCNGHCE